LRALFLVTGSLEEFRAKGVAGTIEERDEGGRLSRVVTAHLSRSGARDLELSSRHRVLDLPIASSFASRPLAFLRALRHIVRVARSERVDLIRATDPYAALLAMPAAAILRIPWCLSLHADFDLVRARGGSPVLWGSRALTNAAERAAISRAPLILAISTAVARYARRHGALAARLRLIPHGVDTSLFGGSAPDGFLEGRGLSGRAVVSFVGRLDPEKDVDVLPELAARLAAEEPSAVVVVVGDGAMRGWLDEARRERALGDHLLLAGRQTRNEVAAWRAASAVNLCGLGDLSLIEAAASGRPVVAVDVGSAREIIVPERTGLLAAPGDPAAIARAVVRLLRDPDLSRRLGETARADVLARHTLAAASARRIACYEELLGSAARA